MAINIRFLADVADWIKGLGTSKEALGDNERGLEELMKKAIELGTQLGKTTEEIAQDFSTAFGVPLDRAKEAVEETVRSTGKLGDAAKDAGRDVKSGMEDAADSTSKVDDATSTTGDGLSKLGGIARDVLNGDFVSAAQGAQEALGGIGKLAEVGGPIAMALGALAGILGETLGAAAEEARKRTDSMFEDMVESGEKAISSAEALRAAHDMLLDPAQREKAQRIADVLGIDLPDAILALVGDQDALAASQDALADKMDNDVAGRLGGKYNEAAKAINETAGSLDNAGARAGILDDISARLAGTGGAADQSSGRVQTLFDKLSNPPSVPPISISLADNTGAQMDAIVRRLSGRSVTVGVGTVLKDKWDGE